MAKRAKSKAVLKTVGSPARVRSRIRKKKKAASSDVRSERPSARSAGRGHAPSFIVGIGSSAGGLEALRALFGELKGARRLSFVVVQHLAPNHRSRMVELIAHSTLLPVREVRDGQIAECGMIYITPPNKDVSITPEGKLKLREPRFSVGPKPSIDLFFQSLAENIGERAVGIVLSGTGSDGSHGICSIKAAGGVTICQSPESAKYDGMPKAARHTGSVDLELAPEKIARELERLDRLERSELRASTNASGRYHRDPYREILEYLERSGGACFADYKQSTVHRRIERRMVATRCEAVEDYLKTLREDANEAKALFQDILISVTSFFRDPESFKALRRELDSQIQAKPAGSQYRCWVAGCATGEEAYTLAILLLDAISKSGKSMPLQIFATDLDEHALGIARRGVYSKASLRDIPTAIQKKYFNANEDGFQVKQAIRDRVVFARHDLTRDPPFLKLDLISCRNVLIYFNPELQDKVFFTFYYALDRDGRLFLGRSEAASGEHGAFELLDKRSKIYRRVNRKGEVPRLMTRLDSNREARIISDESRGKISDSSGDLFHAMVAAMVPDSVLVDGDFHIRHIFGNGGDYLRYPEGEANPSITRLVASEMSVELAAILHRASRSSETLQGRVHLLGKGKSAKGVQLRVTPLQIDGKKNFLVSFCPSEHFELGLEKKAREPQKNAAEAVRRLEKELARTRDHLQSVVEEQETSSEELQALNEELQSANEELQSSNEELETTNEELQSTNEELTTVNQELNVKTSELLLLNQRLQAIQNAIVYPLMIVDRQMNLVTFNPTARHLLRINEGDIGSSVHVLPTLIDLGPVLALLEDAFKKAKDLRTQFNSKERSFEVQVQLFRGARNSIEGAVVSFVENTEIVAALEESRVNRSRLSSILENTPALVTMKDLSGVYVYANQRFCDVMGRSQDKVIGRTDEEIFGADTGAAIRSKDIEVIRKKTPIEVEENLDLHGVVHHWATSKFPIFDARARVQSVCAISLDITERVEGEAQLQLFRKAMTVSNSGVVIFRENDRTGALRLAYASEELYATLGEGARKEVEGGGFDGLIRRLTSRLSRREAEKARVALLSEHGSTQVFEVPGLEGDGDDWLEVRNFRFSPSPVSGAYVVLSLYDVTQRVRTERILQQQQEELVRFNQFAALGEIAAGVAHEVNTPLNVITTKTGLMRRMIQQGKLDNSSFVKSTNDIEQMVRTISEVVEGLKAVAGVSPSRFERGNLVDIARDSLKVCEYRLERANIEVRTHFPPEGVYADCYPVQITQILVNLIKNAIDAVTGLAERWVRIDLSETPVSAIVDVSDSGNGIDPAIAEKIMAPFFTTKTSGTGIGLSLSRTVAQKHGGSLTLVREAAHTTFRLELPKNRQ